MIKRLSPSRIGRWSARRPWPAIGLWLAFVVAAVAAMAATGTKPLDNGAVGQSARGYALMDAHRLGFAPREYAYLHSGELTVSAPEFAAAIERARSALSAAIGAPIQTRIAAGRRSALLTGAVRAQFDTATVARALSAGHPQVSVVVGSPGEDSAGSDLRRAERLSVPVTLLVLLIAFGAIVAAGVPVLLAVTAVVAAFGLLGPISQAFPLDDSVKTVVLLIGMAVGVDYALFYVVRSREERARGLGTEAALDATARTSGRSIAVAGVTVMIAMAGQFAIGSNVFDGIAAGTIAVVACAVVGSLTLLPALLALLGPRLDRGRIPGLPHLALTGESRLWRGVVDRVLRRPWLAAGCSTALLVALAVPALGMHVAKPSALALSPAGQDGIATRITAEFPGTSTPAYVVAAWSGDQRAAADRAAHRLIALALRGGIAHGPAQLAPGGDGRSLAIALPLTGLGDNAASRDAIAALRERLVPATLGTLAGVRTAVTGDTAQDVDFTAQMTAGIPFVVAFVLTLAFVVLLLAFRSIVVPIKAIVLNLLSVAASYGVLVLVFQHRWAQGLLGFHSSQAIVSWLPLFLFVVLFGLSMDYHVFILSRVREGVDDGLSTAEALRRGIARTAGVVTSAALVMVGVFSLFGTSSSLDLKQAGVGLAAAILIDSTLIRAVLLPAAMALLDERNWYLPPALHRALRSRRRRPAATAPEYALR
jgi:putative drug exporter of the RND superfamily